MDNIKLNTFIRWMHIGAWIIVLFPITVVTLQPFIHIAIVNQVLSWSLLNRLLYYLALVIGIIVFGFRLKEVFKGGKWYSLITPCLLIILASFIIWVCFNRLGVTLPLSIPIPPTPVSSN